MSLLALRLQCAEAKVPGTSMRERARKVSQLLIGAFVPLFPEKSPAAIPHCLSPTAVSHLD
eukprot:scaffold214570_cov30-Tisochrysis_lutea.AAC.3